MVSRMEAEHRVYTGFWIHLAAYVAVITGLAILNVNRNPDNLWVLWVAGGWGIGIALHALGLFVIPGGRERMIERTADRLERREVRHAHRHTPA